MAPGESPPIPNGSLVRRISNPDQAGTVLSASWDVQVLDWHYKIRFGTGSRGVPASDIERMPEDRDLVEELLRGRSSNAASFRTLLTFERLRKPPSRIAASFGSAKAAFYPFQFLPLLKFLESPGQRILIADDVGLGKTIEAGYALRELRARTGLQRILVVVPAQLKSKWKWELERRFSEHFEIVGSREFSKLKTNLERGRELEPFRWIASYEAVRGRNNIAFFNEFRPPIDLAIFDEAHRLRNPQTLQARFGRALADSADALLLLTATPIQTKIDDLFWLLNLVDPARYSSPQIFAQQVEANRPVIRALSWIRRGPEFLEEARSELTSLERNPLTAGLTQETFFDEILCRLDPGRATSRRELVALQREVSELSLTGAVITRTRKAEVYPDRQPRKAQTIEIELSPVEAAIYQGIGHLFQVFRQDLDERGLRLALTTLHRMAGSCLPAAAGRFRRLIDERLSAREMAAEYDTGDEAAERLESAGGYSSEQLIELLRGLLRDYNAREYGDSKFDLFLRALEQVWSEDRGLGFLPRKVIVFSTYLGTIDYLQARLIENEISCLRIDGKTAVTKREELLEAFQNDDVSVLLSSEVGSEGIDLQFASVMVNYDLPWNPMIVEQRIGRLDRIGQSNPVVIVNLVLKNTIEERIVHRLFERIGVFRETIGELEPILGDETIEDLLVEALSSALTPEEEERKADEVARVLIQQEAATNQVREGADALLAADQAFLDEIESLTGGRRVPNARELLGFLTGVLDTQFPGCEVPTNLIEDVDSLRVTGQVVSELRKLPADPEAARVTGLLEGGAFRCTFSQMAALRHPRADLLHGRHPLIQFAFEWMARRGEERFRGFHLSVASDAVKQGLYAFGICFLEVFGGRPRTELRTIVLRLGEYEPMDEAAASEFFALLLDRGVTPARPLSFDETAFEKALGRVRDLAHGERQRLLRDERSLNEARAARKRATLENTHRARVEAAQRRLRALRARGAADFAVRMAVARREKVNSDFRIALEALKEVEVLRVEDEEVALGLVAVGEGA